MVGMRKAGGEEVTVGVQGTSVMAGSRRGWGKVLSLPLAVQRQLE